jgi:hypothetical protein
LPSDAQRTAEPGSPQEQDSALDDRVSDGDEHVADHRARALVVDQQDGRHRRRLFDPGDDVLVHHRHASLERRLQLLRALFFTQKQQLKVSPRAELLEKRGNVWNERRKLLRS